jgi:large subunit ribosomal protein L10
MSKVIKQMEMDAMKSTFGNVRDMVVLTTDKLSSQGEYTLRASLRKKGVRLKMVKNSLCRRVLKELKFNVPDKSDFWKKPTVLAWGGNSIAELSREVEAELKNPKNAGLYKEKDKEKVVIKGAIADGTPVPFDVAIKMPTREELISQIIGMFTSPGSAIAGVLVGVGNQIAGQVDAHSENLKKAEAGAAPPAA